MKCCYFVKVCRLCSVPQGLFARLCLVCKRNRHGTQGTKISKCHVILEKSEINLIGAIISIDEKWAPPRGQGLAVYAVAVVLRCNEGLASHHIQYRLVLASGEPQICVCIYDFFQGDDILKLSETR